MKRTILAALLAATLLTVVGRPAQATEVGYGRKFGLGFVLGDPTGLSAKYWIGGTNALDFGLGFWGYGVNQPCPNDDCPRWGYHNGTFNMDYLWQSRLVSSGGIQLDWHVGAGGRIVWWGGNCAGDCTAVAARAPIGLDLMFQNPSFLEVFFELAPAFYVIPGFGFGIEGGLGVRLYF